MTEQTVRKDRHESRDAALSVLQRTFGRRLEPVPS